MSQLAADLRRGVNTMNVPVNLEPPLSKPLDAKPLISRNGCSRSVSGIKSDPCIYGATTSHTSVVLFGDSHAAAWFPALDLISKQQHWRLVIFTKDVCPPPAVAILSLGTPNPDCPLWRADALNRIAEMHPALVVVAGARYPLRLVRRCRELPLRTGAFG